MSPARSPYAPPGTTCARLVPTSWWSRRAATTGPGAQAQADALVAAGLLPDGVHVHAVDADAHWARPGPRLVDGVEELAGVLVGYSSTQKPRPPNQSP